MAEEFGTPITPEEGKSKSRVWIIVVVIVVVLLCCCCFSALGVSWLWNNGDQLLEDLSLIYQNTHFLI